MFVTRVIPLTNFFVATSALCFQVTVLYPWHKQLDDDFEELKKEHLRVLSAIKETPQSSTAAIPEKSRGVRDMLSDLGRWKM